ncbi:MAG: polyprenyl synthetase family protein [Phycisphaerales bacterium]
MTALLPVADAQTAALLARELGEVEVIFERQLASDLPAVNSLCKHVERYRGKMLRPTLVLATGLATAGADGSGGRSGEVRSDEGGFDGEADRRRAAARGTRGPVSPAHRTVAAVVEMIHMATLVHDDVLDEADVRRQGATVNHLRGNEMAVMLGDYLISNAFHLCSTIGDPRINLFLGETTNTLCEGELVQLHHRDNLSLDEATYFEIVRRKTAVLVGACCRLGASLSGAGDEVVDAMRRFGLALGVAFQIQDDLLDLSGQPELVGKSLGRDLAKGKLTLPVILHLAGAGPRARSESIELIERRDAVALLGRLVDGGSIASARERAKALVDDAKSLLDVLADSPARDLLVALSDAIVARER